MKTSMILGPMVRGVHEDPQRYGSTGTPLAIPSMLTCGRSSTSACGEIAMPACDQNPILACGQITILTTVKSQSMTKMTNDKEQQPIKTMANDDGEWLREMTMNNDDDEL